MWQLISRLCFFPLIIATGGLLVITDVVFAQEETAVPKVLNAGDSLLIKDLYFKGLQQKSAGQLAAAEKTFDRVVTLQPDNDAAHFELARIYFENGDLQAAEQSAKQAADLNPDNEWYWNMLLDIYKKTANVSKMPPVFDELIRLHPDKAANYRDKAYVLQLGKQYQAALAMWDTIADKFGETDEHYLAKRELFLAQGDTRSAIGALKSLVSKNPEDSRGYILLAELYTDTGMHKEALELLDKAAEFSPDEPLVSLGKSDTYLAMGRQKQAYEYLNQAFLNDRLDIDAKAGILYAALSNRKHRLNDQFLVKSADLLVKLYPREAKAHAVSGDVHAQLKQLEAARQAYLDALDVNQYIDGVWQQLLQVELQMARFTDVETHGKEALALFPNHPLLLFFTGHGFLGNRQYEEARTYLENALNNTNQEHMPLLTQVYASLGDTYNALGMHAESDVAYQESITLDSTNAYALNNYAYYLALRGKDLSQAAEMSRRSIELTPDFASYEDTYAWVLFQQGKYNEALHWIKKAMKNSGEASDTLLEHYGDILAKLGDIDAAVAQWKKARVIAESVGKNIDKLSKKIDAKQYFD